LRQTTKDNSHSDIANTSEHKQEILTAMPPPRLSVRPILSESNQHNFFSVEPSPKFT